MDIQFFFFLKTFIRIYYVYTHTAFNDVNNKKMCMIHVYKYINIWREKSPSNNTQKI